ADVLIGAVEDACFGPSDATLVPPQLLAIFLRETALAALRAPRADETTAASLEAMRRYFAARGRLRESLPAPVVELLRALLLRPYIRERALIVALLSREPFRRLNRELMVGTLLDYSRRLRTTFAEGGMAKSWGALGRLAGEAVKKSTSAIGTLAP